MRKRRSRLPLSRIAPADLPHAILAALQENNPYKSSLKAVTSSFGHKGMHSLFLTLQGNALPPATASSLESRLSDGNLIRGGWTGRVQQVLVTAQVVRAQQAAHLQLTAKNNHDEE